MGRDNNTFGAQLDAYITLILKVGLNLQRGQVLVINAARSPAPVEEVADFIRKTTRKAYELGARDVHVLWGDADVARARMERAPEEALSEVAMWQVRWLEELSAQGAAFLTPYAPDPDLFAGIDAQRIATATLASQRAMASFSAASSNMDHAWVLAAVPSHAWARKVFPQMDEAEAVAALWRYIFRTTRVDTANPIRAWREHVKRLNARATFLNRAHFRKLHYTAPGTRLSIALPKGHIWMGGDNEVGRSGVRIVPNLPTEEVFTLPQRDGVEGVVRSTMPLNYNGTLIQGLRLTFEGGRIVDYAAKTGEEALKSIVETDEGACFLGEVALVTQDSPVNIGTPVYNTLFDENASCHLAIGRAYPMCLKGGEQMSREELAAHGVNYSLAHVDFMIGSEKLDVDGETASGARVPVLRGGMWAAPETASGVKQPERKRRNPARAS